MRRPAVHAQERRAEIARAIAAGAPADAAVLKRQLYGDAAYPTLAHMRRHLAVIEQQRRYAQAGAGLSILKGKR